jgi:DNA-directed RNA polymerase specialized sigma24 family protein
MTAHRRRGASRGTPTDRAGRASGANRWNRKRRAEFTRARPLALREHPQGGPESRTTALQLEDLWDHHGRSVYALACALLGDEAAATQAVTLGMTDLAHATESVSAKDARRSLARHVYWRSQELADETPRTLHLPPPMVWLGQLAQLQRACLALCVFGGHTHRETAGLLGVAPMTVAELVTAALREVGRLAAVGTATNP